MKTTTLLTIYFQYCLPFQLFVKTFQFWHIITLSVHTNFASLTNFHRHLKCAQQFASFMCVYKSTSLKVRFNHSHLHFIPCISFFLQFSLALTYNAYCFFLHFLLVFDCSLETHPSRISIKSFHNGAFKSLKLL